jgi:DNA-directed RNA polymerase sigma subunit (sigma70/sigma32)
MRSTMDSDPTTIDSLDRFLHAIGAYPRLSPAETTRLAERAASGDPEARSRLIESNLRLVVSIAKDHRHSGLAFLDVIQEGVLGLIEAVDTFRPELGRGFGTYAGWCIKRAIREGMEESLRLDELDRPEPDPHAGALLADEPVGRAAEVLVFERRASRGSLDLAA